jgi:hypothetical protein
MMGVVMLIGTTFAHLGGCFWRIFLEYFQKNLQFKIIIIISLYYFVKVCVKKFPKKCHFQSFSSSFSSLFIV